MNTKKTIYIIRHGETDYNRQGIIQGSGVDSDLNETGRIQAEKFFKAYHHIPFDKVYTSELKRTDFLTRLLPNSMKYAGVYLKGW